MSGTPETKGLNLVEMLDLLQPIPEPEPISMIPVTQGWLWLALTLFVCLVWFVFAIRRRFRSNAYRRAALRELDAAGNDPARIATILRRTALVAYPRQEVVPLMGEAWLHFLNETCPGVSFDGETGAALVQAPYRGAEPDAELERQSRHWIRKHQRGGKR